MASASLIKTEKPVSPSNNYYSKAMSISLPPGSWHIQSTTNNEWMKHLLRYNLSSRVWWSKKSSKKEREELESRTNLWLNNWAYNTVIGCIWRRKIKGKSAMAPLIWSMNRTIFQRYLRKEEQIIINSTRIPINLIINILSNSSSSINSNS